MGGVIDNDIKIECTPGDIVPEFKENIFAKGFGGIRAQAQALLETVDLNDVENYDRRDFWEAITITCDGFSILCRRHAQAARELAATERDGTRKAELLGIAEACDAIAENPPKTFREAMQLHYFIFVGLFIEGNAGGYSPGRMDQNLYPYYKRDVEAGILTDAEALELIECMWIKFGEQIWYWNEPAATHYAGFCAFQNVCIGGVDMDGLDAVNPLSYLMLQATIDTQMVQPSLSVRLSRKNPEDFFLKIAELIQTGSGFPAIYSDDIGMKQLMKKGIPPELARDWVGLGCVEANMPGKMSQWSSAGHYNIAAAVEFALSNGVHLKSGKKLGLETGDPASFTTFEQFRDAVHAQLDHLLRTFSSMQNLLELLHQRYLPNPVASMVLLDCVEKGKDLMRGGARYNTGPGMNGNGVADYADSMVAVKKLVFDEKKVDMATLADAVKHDFKGYEPLLRLIDEEAPKWGNDDPEADAMVIDLTSFIIKKIAAFRGLLGNQKLPALYPVSSNVPQGMAVGALPSGRRAFRPIAEGCSPCQGADLHRADRRTPFARQLPHTCIDGGTLLNLKFTPASVEGEARAHPARRSSSPSLILTCSMSSSTWATQSCAALRPTPRVQIPSGPCSRIQRLFRRTQPAKCRTTSSAARPTRCKRRMPPAAGLCPAPAGEMISPDPSAMAVCDFGEKTPFFHNKQKKGEKFLRLFHFTIRNLVIYYPLFPTMISKISNRDSITPKVFGGRGEEFGRGGTFPQIGSLPLPIFLSQSTTPSSP